MVLVAKGTYENAWFECLKDGVKVFSDSCASLQYVLERDLDALRLSMLDEGMEAIDYWTGIWSGASEQGLIKQLNRILMEEALQITDDIAEVDEDFFDDLEEYEYGDGSAISLVDKWAGKERLLFKLIKDDSGSSNPRYLYRFQRGKKHQTLISDDEFEDRYSNCMKQYDRYLGKYTEWFTVNRTRATKRGGLLPILRVGHPFVTALEKQTAHDERGVAYAIWRYRPNAVMPPDSNGQLFFRFDFVLEAGFGEAYQHLSSNTVVSLFAIRRRLDALRDRDLDRDADLAIVGVRTRGVENGTRYIRTADLSHCCPNRPQHTYLLSPSWMGRGGGCGLFGVP